MTKYKQLDYDDRCSIYTLLKLAISQNKIAKQLKFSQGTIRWEWARAISNKIKGKRGDCHKQANQKALTRDEFAAKAIKITPSMISHVESKIKRKWSPG